MFDYVHNTPLEKTFLKVRHANWKSTDKLSLISFKDIWKILYSNYL